MISTSCILSTGEKKCTPMKAVSSRQASASPVIGSVEVLEANGTPAGSTAAVFLVTSALMARSSNTASMTKSASFSPSYSVAGVMRASTASAASCFMRPRSTCLASSLAE